MPCQHLNFLGVYGVSRAGVLALISLFQASMSAGVWTLPCQALLIGVFGMLVCPAIILTSWASMALCELGTPFAPALTGSVVWSVGLRLGLLATQGV
jgi:hypothetical protein